MPLVDLFPRPQLDFPYNPPPPPPSVVTRPRTTATATTRPTQPTTVVTRAPGPSGPTREEILRLLDIARTGGSTPEAISAMNTLRTLVQQGNPLARELLGAFDRPAQPPPPTPTQLATPPSPPPPPAQLVPPPGPPPNQDILNRIVEAASTATAMPNFADIVRQISQGLQQVLPQPSLPSFQEAQQQVLGALQPIMDLARQQSAEDWQQALRLIQAQAAARGVVGSDPALQEIMRQAQEQQRAQADIAARFGGLAAEQALNLIGQQLGAFRTVQEARDAAVRNAVALADMFRQARLGEIQARLGTLTDVARLQESARQANLPFQFPTADTQFTQWLQLWLESLLGSQLQNQLAAQG